jgi:hypothetical protein
MKNNWLITLGIGLISAGIGFIVGSKWTEKEIKERNEDFYQREYDLLKESWEKHKEEEIREDERRKCQEMAAEAKKMQTGCRMSDGRNSDGSRNSEDCVAKHRPNPVERAEMEYNPDDESERFDLPGQPNAKRDPRFPYLITYDEYYESDYDEHHMTWDAENEMLIDDEDPEREPDIDAEVTFEALEVLNEGRESIIFVRNERLGCEFVIERMDPRG